MTTTTWTLSRRLAVGIAIAATAVAMALPTAAQAQGLSFGFSVGPDGKPSVGVGVDTGPGVRVRRGTGEVCFYERTRMRGDSFCVRAGGSIRDLDDWADEISSFENEDGYDVTVCTRTNFRGSCRTYSSGARSLGSLDDDIESIRIR